MTISEFINTSITQAAHLAQPIDKLRHVIADLARLGIKAHYDPAADADAPQRVLLHSTRYNSKNFELANECNGLILDYRTWKIVARGVPLPNAQFNTLNVVKNFPLYDVSELRDGTVVRLYHYMGQWRIATARGIDMSAVSWCGITYGAALAECMAEAKRAAPEGEGLALARELETASRALDMSELDPDVTYTVGFTHPRMHYTQQRAFWIISARHTETGTALDVAQYECATEPPVPAGTFASLLEVQARSITTDGWGFMLRSRDPTVTGADSVILIESRRMTLVRRIVYDRKNQTDADAFGVTRDALVFVQYLINASMQQDYVRVYPARAELQQRALQAVTALATDVISGSKKSTAVWFRGHIERECPAVDLAQVTDYILQKRNISILLQYLADAALLP